MKNESVSERIERNMLDSVNSCRAGVMDTVDLELGDKPNWQFIRARLLRSFGDRGLSGRIREILNAEFGCEGGLNNGTY